jgi:transglutaminase-like putative cysteine protease
MRLTVRHRTEYRYSQPIAYAIQTLRLTPRSYDGIAVLSWRVRGEGRGELPVFVDGFGNITHCHTVNRPHEFTVVTVEGEVDTRPDDGAVRGAIETLPAEFYLRATPLTVVTPEIAALAAEIGDRLTAVDRLTALMETVRGHVDYRAGVTTTMTTAGDALRARAGVCQDHAHLFIAACRALGIPARYVGGYLWTGDATPIEASHAWSEAYVAGHGWIGFDAANRTRPNEAYIRTAIGLDYWSAAPIRGVRRGAAEERLGVSVQVLSAQQ